MRIRVDDVRPGTRYEDLCVSEVSIDARSTTRPAAPPAAEAGPGVPSSARCVVQMPTDAPFHLRSTDTTSRTAAAEVPGGTTVELLRAGESWRSHATSRTYFVRVMEGAFANSTCFVFLHPSELAARPECPR